MSRKFKVPVGLVVLDAPPASPSAGDFYLDTNVGLLVYTGEGWQATNTPNQVDGENLNFWDAYSDEGMYTYEGGSSPTSIPNQTFDGGKP